MRWIRERDELIAQTMAFVQSVTGRKDAPAPVTTPAGRSRDDGAGDGPVLPTAAPAPPPDPSAARPAPARPSSDIRLEMHARIAGFRKHQERFAREREEYCAATLMRLRTTLREGGTSAPPPPPWPPAASR